MPERPKVVRIQERNDSQVDLYTTGGYAHNQGLARVVRTKHQTFACMTCLRIDCEHASAAGRHYAAHGAAMPAEATA